MKGLYLARLSKNGPSSGGWQYTNKDGYPVLGPFKKLRQARRALRQYRASLKVPKCDKCQGIIRHDQHRLEFYDAALDVVIYVHACCPEDE